MILRLLNRGDKMREVLSFLQSNAEWMSAIGLVVFAAVQVWLMHVQNRQQIRLQRINLANEMCKIFYHYPYSAEKCGKMMDWLMENRAKFKFLLKKSDMNIYWNLVMFIDSLSKNTPYNIGTSETDRLFFGYTNALVEALGNAKNNLVSYKSEYGKCVDADIKYNESKNAKK